MGNLFCRGSQNLVRSRNGESGQTGVVSSGCETGISTDSQGWTKSRYLTSSALPLLAHSLLPSAYFTT